MFDVPWELSVSGRLELCFWRSAFFPQFAVPSSGRVQELVPMHRNHVMEAETPHGEVQSSSRSEVKRAELLLRAEGEVCQIRPSRNEGTGFSLSGSAG